MADTAGGTSVLRHIAEKITRTYENPTDNGNLYAFHRLGNRLICGYKLASPADLGFISYTLHLANRESPLTGPKIGTAVLMNLCFAGTIAEGAFLSIEGDDPDRIKMIHCVGPYATVLTSGLLLYMLEKNRSQRPESFSKSFPPGFPDL